MNFKLTVRVCCKRMRFGAIWLAMAEDHCAPLTVRARYPALI